MRPTLLAILLLPLLLVGVARAQDGDVTVNARLSQQQAYVGEILEYQIVVQNGRADEEPEIRWPKGVEASYAGSNSMTQQYSTLDPATQRMKLVSQNTTLYSFRLVTTERGTHTIPGTTVNVNGKAFTTDPVTFRILDAPEAEDFDVVAELDRTRVYVGETLHLQVHWYLSASVSEYSFRPSEKPDSIEAIEDDAVNQQSRREQLYPVDIFGIRTVARLRDATYNGQRTRVLYFEVLLRPTKPGLYDLGPIGVLFDQRTPRGSTARSISKSEPIQIQVFSPPTKGQPEGYNGLIGQFEIESSATPTAANVGEPIDLTVRIRGDEPMNGVKNGPNLAALNGFTDDFRLSPDGWKREPSVPGERVFSTKIRALNGGVESIPEIRLPYFDPVKSEYATATTRPIPLDITSVRTTTIDDAIGNTSPTPEAPSIERSGPIFWAEDRGPSLLRRDPVSPLAIVQSPGWISLAAVPPATYALAFVVGAWTRKRNPELTQKLSQLRAARKTAESGDHPHAAASTLCIALGIDPEAVTSADALRLPIAVEHRESLAAAVRLLETGFDDDHNQTPPPPPPVIDAIDSVKLALKRGAL